MVFLKFDKSEDSNRGVLIPGLWFMVPAFAKDVFIPRASLWWLHEGNRALRVGDWKLVAAKGDPWELYDLRTDRAEQINLALKMPDKVKELEHVWQEEADRYAPQVK